MKILSRHYQNVTNLRFTDNGSHFVSAGDDNLVIVWSFLRFVHVKLYLPFLQYAQLLSAIFTNNCYAL